MLLVALAAIAAAVAATLSFAGLLRSLIRQHARERDLLINQLLHATGKPWAPAPAAPEPVPEPEPRSWTASPEQLPADDY